LGCPSIAKVDFSRHVVSGDWLFMNLPDNTEFPRLRKSVELPARHAQGRRGGRYDEQMKVNVALMEYA
jgi:hypothetical protein